MNYMKYLRIRRNLTQRGLAELLKLNPVVVCKIENGWLAKPPGGVEERLKAVFGEQWNFRRLMQAVPDLSAQNWEVDTDAPAR